MARYEYRYLDVDELSDDRDDSYFWLIVDSGSDEEVRIDHKAESLQSFRRMAATVFIGYLNGLGAEGWEVMSYNARIYSPISTFSESLPAPLGGYLLKRATF